MNFRKHILNTMFGIGLGTTTYYVSLMHHNIFIEKYRRFVAMYRNGIEVRIRDIYINKCKEVMNDLRISEDNQSLVKPFHVFGFDLFHAGAFKKPYGAILGIPINFTYNDSAAIPKLEILFKNDTNDIDWSSEEAKNLLKSLIFSDDAKKYAIAREILGIQNNLTQINSAMLAIIILTLSVINSMISHRYPSQTKSIILRCVPYSVLISSGLVVWLGLKDSYSCHFDKNIDEAIAVLGSSYVNGGKEFYEKMLIRNAALRILMGKTGEKHFTISGNMNYFIRQKSLPLTQRKQFFQSKLHDI